VLQLEAKVSSCVGKLVLNMAAEALELREEAKSKF